MDIAGVAHDLRTPLTVMLGHTQLLAIESLSDAGRRRLQIMEAQIRRMTALIDKCLLEPARRPYVIIDLDTTITAVVAELETVLQERGIEFVRGGEESLPCVPSRGSDLHRVLMNVFVNAADAMPNGGRIHVHARTEKVPATSSARIVLDISDTGSGIAAEVVPYVFERGFTTKLPGRGTGLGLAICREIVREHGGEIELSTEPGQGTTVRIYMPVRAVRASDLQAAAVRRAHCARVNAHVSARIDTNRRAARVSR